MTALIAYLKYNFLYNKLRKMSAFCAKKLCIWSFYHKALLTVPQCWGIRLIYLCVRQVAGKH